MSAPTDPAVPLPAAAARAVRWSWLPFAELGTAELYAALALRQRVFVVEQSCPFLDADGRDDRAHHLLGWVDDADGRPLLAAYVRVFPPGVLYPEATISRVVTHPAARRTGLGRELMAEAIRRTEALAPGAGIRLGAQRYLERFYEGFGFHTVSPPYDEDGIEHVEMLRD